MSQDESFVDLNNVWQTFSHNFEPDEGERPIFACCVIKHRSSPSLFQSSAAQRHLLLTTHAIYCFEPDSYSKPNRAIRVKELTGLIMSTSSMHMLIQTCDKKSYDYFMEALSATSRSTLIDELRNAFRGVQPDECDQFLPLLESAESDLSSLEFCDKLASLKKSLDKRNWLNRRCIFNVVPPTVEIPHLEKSENADFLKLKDNAQFIQHTPIQQVEGSQGQLLFSCACVVFRNHDKQDVHVVLTEHHVLIFDEKEYEKPLTSIALANLNECMISKYQVLLDLHSANDIVLRFEEVEERSTFCHVLLAQHRAAAGFKLIPVVEDSDLRDTAVCSENLPRKLALEKLSTFIVQHHQKVLDERVPIEEWESVELPRAPSTPMLTPVTPELKPRASTIATLTLADYEKQLRTHYQNANHLAKLRGNLNIKFELDRQARLAAQLNPFELRASDDLASEFRFDFGYLENHAKLRQALNALEHDRCPLLFSDYVDWNTPFSTFKSRVLLVVTEMACYLFEDVNEMKTPKRVIRHSEIDGLVLSSRALPLCASYQDHAECVRALPNQDRPSSGPIKVHGLPSSPSAINPIVLEAFDHEHSHSLAVQVSPLNQDDLLLSFCNQYRCECLALVLREQVQRARGLVEEEYELLPHIANVENLSSFVCLSFLSDLKEELLAKSSITLSEQMIAQRIEMDRQYQQEAEERRKQDMLLKIVAQRTASLRLKKEKDQRHGEKNQRAVQRAPSFLRLPISDPVDVTSPANAAPLPPAHLWPRINGSEGAAPYAKLGLGR